MKDIAIICALLLAVAAGAFAGSAAALYEVKKDIAMEMAAMRADYTPAVCRLFSSTPTGTGQP